MTSKRISLWSGPRNVSTALMYSFANRSDTKVVDEPLYGHYLRVSGAQHPGRNEVLENMELDGKSVVADLCSIEFEQPLFFIKNMAHHLVGLEYSFLDSFCNVLLIRDPREMLTSLINQIPNPIMRDTGLQQQWELFQYLENKNLNPLVLDSREILLDPEGVLKEACKLIEIPYLPEMINWTPGALDEDGIWAKYWYHNVHKSSGFQEYRPKNDKVPEHLMDLYDECNHYYHLLYGNALKSTI